jgi:serine/threonine-protein kinase HipA
MSSAVIEVRAWGRQVGAVAPDPRLGYYAFAYAPAWLDTGIELAPRTMPAADYKGPYIFTSLPEATFHHLPGLLADALPDDFGNALVNAFMQSRGRTLESISTLDRLAYMGKRGMGALEFRPAMGSRTDSTLALDMKSLVENARKAVHGELSRDEMAATALNQIIRVGTSAGGARAKAVLQWNPQTQELRSGQFTAAPGFEHWLLKFDGMGRDPGLGKGLDFGRTEFAYHLMAKAAGIQMTECRLLHENGRAHFMTQRFDREGDQKHHVQTLCGMEHLDFKQLGTHSYAQAFMVMAALKLGQAAVDELFRRMAFNVLAQNCDDHTKNLAFILKQGEPWALAPAYDVTFAHNPAGLWTFQHQLSVNGKFKDIKKADLLQDAERFGVRSPAKLLSEVAAAVGSFDQFAKEAGLPGKKRDEVRKSFCGI